MRNAMKIGLVLAALVVAGVYSVSAEDVSQQAVLNGTVVSVIEAGTPVKEGDVLVSVDSLVGEPIGMAWSKRSASRRARRSPNRTS